MNDRPSLIHLRVWSDFACFTRPELKAERVSYGLMTPSAARGVLEAIYYEPEMAYRVHQIGVIHRGRWLSFRRNEVSKVVRIGAAIAGMTDPAGFAPIRAGGGAADGTQRGMLALTDVEYLISAEVQLTDRARPPRSSLTKYYAQALDRAAKGKCFHRPYLGCREFAADFEPVEDPVAVTLEDWSEDLGILLYDVFDPRRRTTGDPLRPDPVFFKNAQVQNGRLDCHPERVELIRRRLPGRMD
jgi:CRISPR-associated protein Cas5d